MHRPIITRRQELVLEGHWHFPIGLLDFEKFRRWYNDRCPRSIKGDLFSDSTTVVLPAADLSAEPDIVFCSWDGYRSGRVRQSERVPGSERFVELVGAPDLVVEVVSTTSTGKDKRRLRAAYWKAGVPEYWILDARGKKGVRFELLVRGDDDYQAVEPDAAGYRLSPTFQRRFRIVRRRNPVGRYMYRLLQRKSENP
jgi:Uma2 family endonuclease